VSVTEREDPLRNLGRFLAEEVGMEPSSNSTARLGNSAETHFELGLAFVQMGLLEDALRELGRAAEEPRLRASSAALLGSVHLERGEPERAIGWYRCGLATRGLSRRTRFQLLAELGRAHQLAGEERQAARAFDQAAEIDPNHRIQLAVSQGEAPST
jgi:tetratricopeptide (TPR) repeat protein